ncbi:MAG: hypothetical protein JOZ05_20495 [Acetobacteraceae bacterium]|nr:hypothetical protein [Acetobacteraceae bacterium]
MQASAVQEPSAYNRDEPGPFDLWLKRILKDRYGRIAHEPIPIYLLEMLGSQSPER